MLFYLLGGGFLHFISNQKNNFKNRGTAPVTDISYTNGAKTGMALLEKRIGQFAFFYGFFAVILP